MGELLSGLSPTISGRELSENEQTWLRHFKLNKKCKILIMRLSSGKGANPLKKHFSHAEKQNTGS